MKRENGFYELKISLIRKADEYEKMYVGGVILIDNKSLPFVAMIFFHRPVKGYGRMPDIKGYIEIISISIDGKEVKGEIIKERRDFIDHYSFRFDDEIDLTG